MKSAINQEVFNEDFQTLIVFVFIFTIFSLTYFIFYQYYTEIVTFLINVSVMPSFFRLEENTNKYIFTFILICYILFCSLILFAIYKRTRECYFSIKFRYIYPVLTKEELMDFLLYKRSIFTATIETNLELNLSYYKNWATENNLTLTVDEIMEYAKKKEYIELKREYAINRKEYEWEFTDKFFLNHILHKNAEKLTNSYFG